MTKLARILIADDDRHVRLVLRGCLEAEGYQVREAGDGFEALDAIIQWAPDVMILDLAMPNLDGMRTLGEIEHVDPHLKPRVIMLTAWASVPAAIKALGLGVSAFLEKPLDPEMLRQAVARAVQGSDEPTGPEQNSTNAGPFFG
jgi:DNA-binding NtrC family response regulator